MRPVRNRLKVVHLFVYKVHDKGMDMMHGSWSPLEGDDTKQAKNGHLTAYKFNDRGHGHNRSPLVGGLMLHHGVI